jgi:hypothetical protein
MVKRLGGGWRAQGTHRAALILGQIRVYPGPTRLRFTASALCGQGTLAPGDEPRDSPIANWSGPRRMPESLC